jgi:hypothetical protein
MTIERLELLKRVNAMIVRLRRALAHDHGDEPWWTASGFTAREAQRWRRRLAVVADALHVERATARGRVHATRFASLDEQRRWVDETARWRARAEEFVGEVGLPSIP